MASSSSSSSSSSHSINLITCPSTKPINASIFPKLTSILPMKNQEQRKVYRSIISRQHHVVCSAVQESSSASTVTAKAKEEEESSKASGKEAAPVKPKPKPKPAGKTPPKPLPELMQEDVIPSLQTILEAQNDLSEIQLSFNDNRLQGSFQKNGIPHSFWAFFPDGVLTGPKGFSLSSYGTGVSTVEPFLIDEKKITSKHVVFWVEKRLAAQGILPVWEE